MSKIILEGKGRPIEDHLFWKDYIIKDPNSNYRYGNAKEERGIYVYRTGYRNNSAANNALLRSSLWAYYRIGLVPEGGELSLAQLKRKQNFLRQLKQEGKHGKAEEYLKRKGILEVNNPLVPHPQRGKFPPLRRDESKHKRDLKRR